MSPAAKLLTTGMSRRIARIVVRIFPQEGI
jgi:hypothetical protein